MRSGDRHNTRFPNKPVQRIRTVKNPDVIRDCPLIFGIVRPQGTRDHHGVGFLHGHRVVSDLDWDSNGTERIQSRRIRSIGTGHRYPAFDKHPRDSTHSTSTDSNEVDSPEILRQFGEEIGRNHEYTLTPRGRGDREHHRSEPIRAVANSRS